MDHVEKMFEGKKTYLVAISAVLIAVGNALNEYATGQKVDIQIVVRALIALALIFLRKGLQTEIDKIP